MPSSPHCTIYLWWETCGWSLLEVKGLKWPVAGQNVNFGKTYVGKALCQISFTVTILFFLLCFRPWNAARKVQFLITWSDTSHVCSSTCHAIKGKKENTIPATNVTWCSWFGSCSRGSESWEFCSPKPERLQFLFLRFFSLVFFLRFRSQGKRLKEVTICGSVWN